MKISKNRLKEIIMQEVKNIMERNPYGEEKDGRERHNKADKHDKKDTEEQEDKADYEKPRSKAGKKRKAKAERARKDERHDQTYVRARVLPGPAIVCTASSE